MEKSPDKFSFHDRKVYENVFSVSFISFHHSLFENSSFSSRYLQNNQSVHFRKRSHTDRRYNIISNISETHTTQLIELYILNATPPSKITKLH